MQNFGVRPEKEKELLDRLARLSLRETDFIEKFVRSGGRGGQNLNKTSTCVYLKHIPSGIEVKVQAERQQNVNRFLARRRLADKYEQQILGVKIARDLKLEKIRKQKARRKRRSKSKIINEIKNAEGV